MSFTPEITAKFQEKIFEWWNDNKRSLPWRETTNPYFIMISEFMLQQTQVSRVIPKYKQFISKYPEIRDLANSSKADIIKSWSGLGYNRRAVWLHETAKQLSERDEFPRKAEELIEYKGIGPYTSKSIPIFAFNKDYATIDTNIRRVLIYEGFANQNTSKTDLEEIAKNLLPIGRSRDWHNALMDYGSIEVTSSSTGIKPRNKQSPFQGSNRQIRGKLLRLVTKHQSLHLSEIKKHIDYENLTEILDSLENDGLLSSEGNYYILPK